MVVITGCNLSWNELGGYKAWDGRLRIKEDWDLGLKRIYETIWMDGGDYEKGGDMSRRRSNSWNFWYCFTSLSPAECVWYLIYLEIQLSVSFS